MLIPLPHHLLERTGHFHLTADTALRLTPGTEPVAALLRATLAPSTGLSLPARADGKLSLVIDPALTGLGPEGYGLTVGSEAVLLRAGTLAGLRNGAATLLQLLPPAALGASPARDVVWRLPRVEITDRPRFPWRGAMLDVARHFQPLSFLKRFVDLLALHKLNVFHLHLTDDQGWRMPVAGHPALTEVGGWRAESMVGRAGSGRFDGVPHGGHYTRGELTELVKHAASRGVTVVPEIELPGHTRALLAAYPHLGNDPTRRLPVWTEWGVCRNVLGVSDAALELCREVLAEVMDVFPAEHVHIGGDECPTVEWESSPAALARVRAEGLSGPAALRGWFLRRMAEFLRENGRTPVSWDEGEEAALPPETLTMSWRAGEHTALAARRGHRVVATPWDRTYLDYPRSADPGEPLGQDGVVTLDAVAGFDPAPARLPHAEAVLGTQAQLWTEFAPTPADVEYLAFPRLAALAEAAWSAPGAAPARGPRSLTERLVKHGERLDKLGVNHRTPHRPPAPQDSPLG
ncbi:hexosaminidase [Streptomyces zhaozhouensis]|uniref:beta-N-acetylhexosaminidase n=1 Tax=Streptomyces zhaozhouensis TaxID=1300267 RepID=A0A286E0B0_9ACTN|nr:beta-N-acetylhexosaminidase [Streptomyces zhaozhouensis]SOD64339.1 hexosaminidase [Streptomyces zhaozhouensis]